MSGIRWQKQVVWQGREVDLYTDGQRLLVVRRQLGKLLGYVRPGQELYRLEGKGGLAAGEAVTAMIERPFAGRHAERLYSLRGAMELARRSQAREARQVHAWLEGLAACVCPADKAVVPASAAETAQAAKKAAQQGLALIRTAEFDGLACDFYGDGKELWLTREQIGRALGYSDAATAITKIHMRHKNRLDKFSVTTKLVGTDGKQYDTYLYSAKGVYEICRWSRQPKADAFFDWVYDILEGLRRGQLALVSADRAKKLAAALQEILTPAEAAKLVEAFTR
ncbi:BRO family protein [Caproiciproducens galactitolivorans]|uniref:BRO family protein n=1 Tax=Caproiciproducens galactitolivorans TaxID=642589 RepID=UPI002409F72A|nr:BRO family protein [Caproiciproducens galactitolivorans]